MEVQTLDGTSPAAETLPAAPQPDETLLAALLLIATLVCSLALLEIRRLKRSLIDTNH